MVVMPVRWVSMGASLEVVSLFQTVFAAGTSGVLRLRLPVASGRLLKYTVSGVRRSSTLSGRRSYDVVRATRRIASRLFSTSSAVVAQDDTLIRIAGQPCHTVVPHQQAPSA